jgi:hypothetical protein
MPHWPDKIAAAVTFDVAFALDFKVGRTLRPLTDLERKVVAKNIADLARAAWSQHVTGALAEAAGLRGYVPDEARLVNVCFARKSRL